MSKFVKGMHGIMREYVDAYSTSETDPRYVVIPSSRVDSTQGRNVAMEDLEKPNIVVRDIVVDEYASEQIVGEFNPSKPNSRKELVMKEVKDYPTLDEGSNSNSMKEATYKDVQGTLKEQLLDEVGTQAETTVVKGTSTVKNTIQVVSDPPMTKRPQPQTQPQTTNKVNYTSNAPKQLVTFYMQEATMGIKYHEVIIKGISLVLAFDRTYEAATVPEFTTTEDNKPFKIVVDGYPYLLHCYYYGQHFDHNNWTYTLFAIFDTEELKNEPN